ncbi:MAG: chemotaxis protein CheX [Candidatus Zixiibacteriota bacterium]|nr:MAG: chemotaxis protein CheX [candidate division Zixibacteria bacterium]
MDVKYINHFISAVNNTFTTMLGSSPERQGLSLKQHHVAQGDISSIIGFAGKLAHGSVALSFPQETALKIHAVMTGETLDKLNKDVQDTVGEIVNIIAGGAKTEFDQEGLSFHISIPTVVVGKDHTIIHKGSTPIVLLPFTWEGCSFVMEISLKLEGTPRRPIRQLAGEAF